MGTRERRDREKRQRRQNILDAARKIFWARGYSGTTMPQIAEAAELAPGTLYLYFPSKNTLYAELLFEGYDILEERLQAQATATADSRRRAEALLDVFLGFAQDYPEYFEVIFFVVQRERRGGPADVLPQEQLERLHARESACKGIAAEVLRAARPNASEADLRALADAVWSMLAGVVFFFQKDEPGAFAVVATQAKRLILDAVFPN